MTAPPLPAGRAWQRMLSGRRLDLLDPSPLDVELEDIAHGLARVARWNGQTHGDHAFSVAQHSVLVEQIFALQRSAASVDEQLAALLHDAPEYVIGDMISPFKQVLGGNYRDVEGRLEAAIHQRFSLPAQLPAKLKKMIKAADGAAAWFEATQLAGFTMQEAEKHFTRPNGLSADKLPLEPWSTAEAQAQFISRYQELDASR